MAKNSKLIQKALVVGGGIGGMSAAIMLRRVGVDVHLVDLDPQWRVYGAGITISGATLRAFEGLGILDEVIADAYVGEGIQICDPSGKPLRVVPTQPVAPHLGGCGGIMRPTLHKILSERTLHADVQVRLGLTVDQLDFDAEGADVRFSDGTAGRYDLVVGADGLFSRVRTLLFPDSPQPEYTGQSVWRIAIPRPPEITRRHYFLGGPMKVGLTPVAKDQMYMFLLETAPRRGILGDDELSEVLEGLLAGYGGPLEGVVRRILPGTGIVLRPLEALELPAPWHAGRAVLIGDAAHPTTPQLASGAGMAIEDALVLGEEVDRATDFDSLLTRFMMRRYARCRLVVSNSIEIGRREQRRAPVEQQTVLVEESLKALAEPI